MPKIEDIPNIDALYDLHEAGRLTGHDKRWDDVSIAINAIAEQEVRRKAKGLYGVPLTDKVDEVAASLMRKFIAKRFTPRRGEMHTILRAAARNDLVSAFRSSRSLTAINAEDEILSGLTAPAIREDVPTVDLVGRVEPRLAPSRFPEYSSARTAVLHFFAVNEAYPGPAFIGQFGVPKALWNPVYTAAVVDCNRAMMETCHEG